MSDPAPAPSVAALDASRERQLASQQIGDIAALEKFEPFNRYWVNQLNRLYRENMRIALSGATPEKREEARHRALLAEELTQMPAKHREAAQKHLDAVASAPAGPRRPTQAG